MKTIVLAGLLSLAGSEVNSQTKNYTYYGQPLIEDNSMLIEEAFNQSPRNIQHITNLEFKNGNSIYQYTQELPLMGVKHQLSFTASYGSRRIANSQSPGNILESGFGDASISYRPLLWGKEKWALIIPRFTLIIPAGNSSKGFGNGGWGAQMNIALTKRLSKTIITHLNLGYTFISKADFYVSSKGDSKYEKDIYAKNIGTSLIWLFKPRLNLVLEYITTFNISSLNANEGKNTYSIINPGFRFAMNAGNIQLVPGMGLPLNFSRNALTGVGTFLYLSIEHAY